MRAKHVSRRCNVLLLIRLHACLSNNCCCRCWTLLEEPLNATISFRAVSCAAARHFCEGWVALSADVLLQGINLATVVFLQQSGWRSCKPGQLLTSKYGRICHMRYAGQIHPVFSANGSVLLVPSHWHWQ
jgi:hypothetical protein